MCHTDEVTCTLRLSALARRHDGEYDVMCGGVVHWRRERGGKGDVRVRPRRSLALVPSWRDVTWVVGSPQR